MYFDDRGLPIFPLVVRRNPQCRPGCNPSRKQGNDDRSSKVPNCSRPPTTPSLVLRFGLQKRGVKTINRRSFDNSPERICDFNTGVPQRLVAIP